MTCNGLQIRVLDDSAYKWLREMLDCFNDGDMHKYDALCTQYASVLNQLPSMVQNERKLREKITILALTELIFKSAPLCCFPASSNQVPGSLEGHSLAHHASAQMETIAFLD